MSAENVMVNLKFHDPTGTLINFSDQESGYSARDGQIVAVEAEKAAKLIRMYPHCFTTIPDSEVPPKEFTEQPEEVVEEGSSTDNPSAEETPVGEEEELDQESKEIDLQVSGFEGDKDQEDTTAFEEKEEPPAVEEDTDKKGEGK